MKFFFSQVPQKSSSLAYLRSFLVKNSGTGQNMANKKLNDHRNHLLALKLSNPASVGVKSAPLVLLEVICCKKVLIKMMKILNN